MKSTTLLSLITVAILALSGCKGAQTNSNESFAGGGVSESDINGDLADSDSGRAMGLQTVYYEFDSSTLSESAKSALNQNTAILKENKSVKIQIEGHCDEKGGIQYNIALGERRAKAAKSYLTERGVASNRITTISYGKEKPLDSGSNEEAWAKNRRSNFRITEK